MRLPRTTGLLSGLIVIILGVWGALVPLIGPYFHYAFGNYDKWHFTTNRLWLDIVPGAVAVIGGWMLFSGSRRKSGVIGGWLAIAAGAWFAIGPAVSLWWHAAGNPIGAPMGGHIRQSLEWIGYFTGLGVAIVGFAAFAMGRFVSRPRVAEEPFVAAGAAAGELEEHHARRRARRGLFRRRRAAAADTRVEDGRAAEDTRAADDTRAAEDTRPANDTSAADDTRTADAPRA
jgi:hypothetical protein